MIEDYPKTILEFEQRFATDAACRAYLMALRWPEGFVCPRCGGCKAWPTVHDRWVCAACRHQATVTAGTIFQDTRQPLRLWFRAMWYVTSQKNGASALGLQRVLGLGGYLTAWSWLHKLRRAMVRPGRERLGGEVEVDETYVGGLAEGPRGRGSQKKVLVAIAAQKDGKGIGRIRLARIADASSQSLRAFVEASIIPGTQVVTDGWEAYTGLPQWGYGHSVHVLGGQGADAATRLLPRVHRVAALLKRWCWARTRERFEPNIWTITSTSSLSASIGEDPRHAVNFSIDWCSRRWRFRQRLTNNSAVATPSRWARLS
jgi:transposase-like protein